MPRFVVFQHVAYEILGTLHPLLKEAGLRIRYVNFGRTDHGMVDMKRYDGLIVLGGPMGVYEADKFPHLNHEIACIKDALNQDKPVLGICLGAQLLAAALGAKVAPAGHKEIGWYDVTTTEAGKADPVLGKLNQPEKIFQWHGDTYELPTGAVRLAHSDLCPQQAFRLGDRVYGMQFHLEVDAPMINRWLTVPSNVAELEPLGGAELIKKIAADSAVHLPRLTVASRHVWQALIRQLI